MTVEEFSNEFDVLLNGPILDEYEKSVFLTKAQEEIVIDLYRGQNPLGDSFEETEEIRRYLDSLIKTYTTDEKIEKTGLSKSSVFFKLPNNNDVWFITYEAVNLKDEELGCISGEDIPVIPITQDEYHRIRKNPFRGANERRALRLDGGSDTVEIISKYNVEKYLVRYLSRPTPIILIDLVNGLKINSESNETPCKLNPVIHRAILERAVKLAIMSKSPSAGKE